MPDKFRYPFTRKFPVTSPYGNRRNPFTNKPEFHQGVDIGAPIGRVIHPIASGRVSGSGWSKALGYWVSVDHGNEVESTYGHMLAKSPKRPGKKVSRISGLGRVGSSGNSTGPHLYLKLTSKGRTLNPQPYIDRH
jgi:murein DD-endopeptidase MepM/ murein hydrolase activator NlpD